MKDHRVAIRYASALLKLAREAGNISEVREGLNNFLELVRKRGDFFLWLVDEEIPKLRRETLLREIASPLGIDQLVLKFLGVLVHRDRIRHIAQINKFYNDLADDDEGILRGRVVLIKEGDGEDIITALENLFSRKFNKKIMLTPDEDASIIGGFLVHMRDKIWDASIKRTLSDIKEKICQ